MTLQSMNKRNSPLPDVPRTAREGSLAALARHSVLQCKRLLMVWSRDPSTLIQAAVYPALMLLMFRVVLGDSITAATGQPSVFGTVPMITIIAAMSGATISALGLNAEQESGLLSRFWTMPIHRAAGLIGRLLAESVRIIATTLLIVATGLTIGFRLDQGLPATFGLIMIPVLFGMGFAVAVTALATASGGAVLVQLVGIVTALLIFFNSGFVPVPAYPIWLQSTVANQPMSCAIDAMKGLAVGGPVRAPLIKTLAWSVGLIVIFAYPAVRGYRRAAELGA